jgi:hypothetical protein
MSSGLIDSTNNYLEGLLQLLSLALQIVSAFNAYDCYSRIHINGIPLETSQKRKISD